MEYTVREIYDRLMKTRTTFFNKDFDIQFKLKSLRRSLSEGKLKIKDGKLADVYQMYLDNKKQDVAQ